MYSPASFERVRDGSVGKGEGVGVKIKRQAKQSVFQSRRLERALLDSTLVGTSETPGESSKRKRYLVFGFQWHSQDRRVINVSEKT